MHVIRARNVHEALPVALHELRSRGISEVSRAGECIKHPMPVTTVLEKPTERVIFWPERDANPFFHFFESLWMLAGRKDLAWLLPFNARMKDFSDDGGITQPGAYGYRWMKHFKRNQIETLIELLENNRRTRRGVIQMYDAKTDQFTNETATRDVPCNTTIYVWNEAGYLNMTVCCRSNDVIWGAYGANAVHFSFLQEYITLRLGLEIGYLYLMSNNFHVYKSVVEPMWELATSTGHDTKYGLNPYYIPGSNKVEPYPIMDEPRWWDGDLRLFMNKPMHQYGYRNRFFSAVARPLYCAHVAWRNKQDTNRYNAAIDIAEQCQASDWRKAAVEWLERRKTRAEAKAA